jgi:hypothetical protein
MGSFDRSSSSGSFATGKRRSPTPPRREAVAPDGGYFAYHCGPLDGNYDFVKPHRGKGSGFFGTGLYVYLNASNTAVRWDKLDVVHAIKRPWEKPFVIDGDDGDKNNHLESLDEFSRGLYNIMLDGSDDLPKDVRSLVEGLNKQFRGTYFGEPEPLMDACCYALHMTYDSYWSAAKNGASASGGGIMPITLVLWHYGYDGVMNHRLDNDRWGSVIYNTEKLKPILFAKDAESFKKAGVIRKYKQVYYCNKMKDINYRVAASVLPPLSSSSSPQQSPKSADTPAAKRAKGETGARARALAQSSSESAGGGARRMLLRTRRVLP